MQKKISDLSVRKLISKNLIRLRSEQHISQLDLYKKSGLSPNFISDIEKCKRGISLETLALLSHTFKVEPYQFFLPDKLLKDADMIQNVVGAKLMTMIQDSVKYYDSGTDSEKK